MAAPQAARKQPSTTKTRPRKKTFQNSFKRQRTWSEEKILLRCKTSNYTKQRPKSVENCGPDIELKALSQPIGTFLLVRSSDGWDLGPLLAGAGALVSRLLLRARSTCICSAKAIPSVLGNDGKEVRMIEQSAVDTIASRASVRRISPSHP
jgi:hypothetical protein